MNPPSLNHFSPEDLALAATARIMQRLKARPLTHLTDAGKTQIETLRIRYRDGAINEAQLGEALLKLGMPKAHVDALLDNELTRRAASTQQPL